jgi:hypothetical protein
LWAFLRERVTLGGAVLIFRAILTVSFYLKEEEIAIFRRGFFLLLIRGSCLAKIRANNYFERD